MNELQIQYELAGPPKARRWWDRVHWFPSVALAALLGLGGGWTAWAWKQQENALRQQALEEQRTRQEETINEVLRQLEAIRAELAAQPKPALPEPVSVPRRLMEQPPRRPAQAAGSMHVQLRTGDVEPEKKPKRGVVKFLTSSIVVDSAVLASSLLVPPSLPLTLAQSRLGRRLTGRIFRKTKTEKTVAAKIVRDVEDMPITRRRRR